MLTILALGSAVADPALATDNNFLLIKGKVIGDKGKPEQGAEIHVLRVDVKAPEVVTTTDRRGQYILAGLPIGDYSVTAYDFHGFPRSRALIKTQSKGWAKVDFDLALDQGRGDAAASRMQTDLRTTKILNQNQH